MSLVRSSDLFAGRLEPPPGLHFERIALEPGIALGLYSWEGGFELRQSVVNDADRIYFTFVLAGVADCRAKARGAGATAGSGHLVFAPDERFTLHSTPTFRRLDLMITRARLAELDADAYERVGDALDRGFLVHPIRPDPRTHQAAVRCAQRLDRRSAPCSSPVLLHAAALELLGCQLAGLQEEENSPSLTLLERRRLLAAKERLLADLSKPPTIAELARATGINQQKLKQGFKLLFGIGVYALFQRHRMERARALLSENSVTDTALILGYSNISHFSAAFRKEFGILPSEVRKGRVA